MTKAKRSCQVFLLSEPRVLWGAARRFSSPRVLAFGSLAVAGARAQEDGQAAGQDSRNPLYGVSDFIGLTTPTGPRPDFVGASRPDEKKMDFIPFSGPEKPRIPVKTPQQVAADQAALEAERQKAAAKLKKLQAEPVGPVTPNAPPPPIRDKF